jgi:UDP-N-acetylmuramyl pentapeptide synthase
LETIRNQKCEIVDAVDDDGVFCIPRNTQRERERERKGRKQNPY